MLVFFGALTPIIMSPDMLAFGRDLYRDITYAIFESQEAGASVHFDGEGAGGAGGGAGADGGGDEPPAEDDPDQCFDWVELNEGFATGPYVFQVKIQGNLLGGYQVTKEDKVTGELTVQNLITYGYRDEQLLMLVEFDGQTFSFKDQDRVSLFTLDGSQEILNRALVMEGKKTYWEGDEHFVSQNNKLVVDLMGLPESQDGRTYGEGSVIGNPNFGNNDGRLDFTDLGCLVFPPWYEGAQPPAPAPAPQEPDPEPAPEETACGGRRETGLVPRSGWATTQVVVPGNVIASFENTGTNPAVLSTVDVTTFGYPEESLLLEVEHLPGEVEFGGENYISLFTQDGGIQIVSKAAFGPNEYDVQGDEFLVSETSGIVLDMTGLTDGSQRFEYDLVNRTGDPALGDNDERLDFSDLGCAVK